MVLPALCFSCFVESGMSKILKTVSLSFNLLNLVNILLCSFFTLDILIVLSSSFFFFFFLFFSFFFYLLNAS
jgi:hypothetical protein